MIFWILQALWHLIVRFPRKPEPPRPMEHEWTAWSDGEKGRVFLHQYRRCRYCNALDRRMIDTDGEIIHRSPRENPCNPVYPLLPGKEPSDEKEKAA